MMAPSLIHPLVCTTFSLLGSAWAAAQEPAPAPQPAPAAPAATAQGQAPAQQPRGPATLVEHLRSSPGFFLAQDGTMGGRLDACDPCRIDWCYCPPTLYGRAEFLWWTRTGVRQVVSVDMGDATPVFLRNPDTNPDQPGQPGQQEGPDVGLSDFSGKTAKDFGSLDAKFREEPGFRVYVGHALQPGLDIEGGILWVRDHRGAADFYSTGFTGGAFFGASTAGSLVSKFATPISGTTAAPVLAPFDFAETASVRYQTSLLGGEINFRWHPYFEPRLPISLVAGLRYLRLQENFDYQAATTITDSAGATRPSQGSYTVQTENHNIGLQIGTDVQYFLSPWWSLIGRGRGGLLINAASQDSAILGAEILNTEFQEGPMLASTPFNATGSGSKTRLAGMVEFGIHSHFQVSQGMAVIIGYNGLLLTHQALAPKQMEFSTAPGAQNLLRNTGSVFYYGPSLGVEFTW